MMPGFILPFRFVTIEAFNNVYLNGGDSDHGMFFRSHYLYDELRGTLINLAEMNEARSRHALVAIEPKQSILAIGGENAKGATKLCEFYEVAENKWTLGPKLNEGRCSLSACIFKNVVYAIGGWNISYFGSIEQLDTTAAEMKWQMVKLAKKNALKPSQAVGAIALNDDEILLFGGSQENDTFSKETYAFNVKSLALTNTRSEMVEGDVFISSETKKFDGIVYAFGYEKGGVHNL